MDKRFLVWPNTTCCGRRLLLLHEKGALRCASRLSAWALPILILHKWYCPRPPFNCSSFCWRHHDLFDSLQWARCWSLAARPQHSIPVARYLDDGVSSTEMWSYQYHSENEAHEVHIFTLWSGTEARWLSKVPRCYHHKRPSLGPSHQLYNIKGHKFIELVQMQYSSEQHESETNCIQDVRTSSVGIQPDRLGHVHCSSNQEAWSCTTTSCQICHQWVQKNFLCYRHAELVRMANPGGMTQNCTTHHVL